MVTVVSWLVAGALGAWLLPLPPWLGAAVAVVGAASLAAALTPVLFRLGVWLGERDHLLLGFLVTLLTSAMAWLVPPLGRTARWRIALLANLSWLAHMMRWDALRVRAGDAQIRRARTHGARHPDRLYLLAHALTMEACRHGSAGRIDLALPMAREAVEVFAMFDGFGDPAHAQAARHIAGHVHDWERGVLYSH